VRFVRFTVRWAQSRPSETGSPADPGIPASRDWSTPGIVLAAFARRGDRRVPLHKLRPPRVVDPGSSRPKSIRPAPTPFADFASRPSRHEYVRGSERSRSGPSQTKRVGCVDGRGLSRLPRPFESARKPPSTHRPQREGALVEAQRLAARRGRLRSPGITGRHRAVANSTCKHKPDPLETPKRTPLHAPACALSTVTAVATA